MPNTAQTDEMKAAQDFIDERINHILETQGIIKSGEMNKRIVPIEEGMKKAGEDYEKIFNELPDYVKKEEIEESVKAFLKAQSGGLSGFSDGTQQFAQRITKEETQQQLDAIKAVQDTFIESMRGMMTQERGSLDYLFTMDQLDKGIIFTKTGIDAASSIPGAAVQGGMTWFSMKQGNPIRPYVDIQNTSMGSVTNPVLQAIEPTAESIISDIGTGTGYKGGDPTSSTHALNPYPVRYPASEKSLEQIPTLQNRILAQILNAVSGAQGKECTEALVNAMNIQNVKTGVNDALPAAAAIHGKMIDLIAKVGPQFRESPACCFQVSVAVDALMRKVTANGNSEFAFDQSLGLFTFNGFPWKVNGYLSSQSAANQAYALFGNFFSSGVIYENPDLLIRMYYETSPGQIVFFTNPAWVTVFQDVQHALVRLFEGA